MKESVTGSKIPEQLYCIAEYAGKYELTLNRKTIPPLLHPAPPYPLNSGGRIGQPMSSMKQIASHKNVYNII